MLVFAVLFMPIGYRLWEVHRPNNKFISGGRIAGNPAVYASLPNSAELSMLFC